MAPLSAMVITVTKTETLHTRGFSSLVATDGEVGTESWVGEVGTELWVGESVVIFAMAAMECWIGRKGPEPQGNFGQNTQSQGGSRKIEAEL